MKGAKARRPSLRPVLYRYRVLLLAGVASELIYALYFLRQFPLPPNYAWLTDVSALTGGSHLGFAGFVAAITGLFLLAVVAWRQVDDRDEGAALPLVLGFGALFVLTTVFVYPFSSHDVYPYIDQSLIMVQYHSNPVFTGPAAFPQDPLMGLSGIWQGFGSPYGPLGIVIDALPTFVVGRDLLANLILIKLMFSAMIVAEAWIVYAIVRRLAPAAALAGALLVAWNPYMILEFSANGHNDIAMMLFIVLAVLSLVESELVFAVVLLVASALVKYATAILIPLFFVHGIAHQRTNRQRAIYTLKAAAASLALAAAAYAPFWEGFATLRPLLGSNITYLVSFNTLLYNVLFHAVSGPTAAWVGRMLFIPIYAYALWLATRSPRDLLRGCVLVTFFALALVLTNVWFWYAVWPVVLAVALPGRLERWMALALSYGSELAVAIFYFVWTWAGSAHQVAINTVTYAVIFVPAAAILIVAGARAALPAARRLQVPGRRRAVVPNP